MNLCQYKGLFGNPGEGQRIYRIFGMAIFDWVVVFICTFIFQQLINSSFVYGYTNQYFSYPLILLFVVLFGIFIHRIFCVRTGLDRMLFPHATDTSSNPFPTSSQ